MIIPIGHDHDLLRRWPLVTFTVIGLCLAVFAGGLVGPKSDPAEVEARLKVAVEYYLEHPELRPDPTLRRVMDALAEQDPAVGAALRARTGTRDDHPLPLERERQRELERLTTAWLSELRTAPHWRWGLVANDARPERFVTHLFVHAGLLHLLFNMLFLYLSGPAIEDAWGRPVFALFYLLAGAASAGFFVAQYPDLAIPLVGASGAIAGVMGAFFVRYPHARLRIFYMLWPGGIGTTSIPAWVALLVWVAGEYFWARMMDYVAPGTGGAGTAYWAHVSGFAFGALAAVVVRVLHVEERLTRVLDRRVSDGDPLWREADRALAEGDTEQAWRALRARTVQHPSDDDAALAFWDLARRIGRTHEASPVLLRLLRSELAAGDTDVALQHWAELQSDAPERPAPLDLQVKVATCLIANSRREEARSLVERALAAPLTGAPPALLFDLAKIATGLDDRLGTAAVERALAHPAQPPAVRVQLERMAAVLSRAPVELFSS